MPDGSAAAGPGTLVLVVGPSGAGKDTLIDRARATFAGRPIVFVRRVVTRPSTAAEAHDTLDSGAFEKAASAGAFAFRWAAHGLHYAIPARIAEDLGAGRTVVCNVSRGIVPDLRARFPRSLVVYVDAPLAIRLGRISGRARATDAPGRAGREQRLTPAEADHVIDNGGSLDDASARFNAILSATLQA